MLGWVTRKMIYYFQELFIPQLSFFLTILVQQLDRLRLTFRPLRKWQNAFIQHCVTSTLLVIFQPRSKGLVYFYPGGGSG